jgi:hypothetical protein
LVGVEFSGQLIPAFMLSVLPGSVALAWLFNRANGSMIPPPLFHATVNTVGAAYVLRMFQGSELVRLWWIYAVLWVIAAVALTIVDRAMMLRLPGDEQRRAARAAV